MASAKKKKSKASTKVRIIKDPGVMKDISDLKSAMYQVANALRQLQLYAKGAQPTQQGLNLLNEYINQVDKVVMSGGIRGLGTP
jgi:hypothetical protein